MYITYKTWQSRIRMEAYKLILFFSRTFSWRRRTRRAIRLNCGGIGVCICTNLHIGSIQIHFLTWQTGFKPFSINKRCATVNKQFRLLLSWHDQVSIHLVAHTLFWISLVFLWLCTTRNVSYLHVHRGRLKSLKLCNWTFNWRMKFCLVS